MEIIKDRTSAINFSQNNKDWLPGFVKGVPQKVRKILFLDLAQLLDLIFNRDLFEEGPIECFILILAKFNQASQPRWI